MASFNTHNSIQGILPSKQHYERHAHSTLSLVDAGGRVFQTLALMCGCAFSCCGIAPPHDYSGTVQRVQCKGYSLKGDSQEGARRAALYPSNID